MNFKLGERKDCCGRLTKSAEQFAQMGSLAMVPHLDQQTHFQPPIEHCKPTFCEFPLLLPPFQPNRPDQKQPIRTRYLGYVTGYRPIRDQYFLIWQIAVIHIPLPPHIQVVTQFVGPGRHHIYRTIGRGTLFHVHQTVKVYLQPK